MAKKSSSRGFKLNAYQQSTSAGVNQASFAAGLFRVRAEDLRPGDFVKIDCATCHHFALLTPEALLRIVLSPAAKVLDLKGPAALPRVREERASGRFD
jgi:hypothetical protein